MQLPRMDSPDSAPATFRPFEERSWVIDKNSTTHWFGIAVPSTVGSQLDTRVVQGDGNKSLDIFVCQHYTSHKFATYTNIFEKGVRK